MWTWIAACAPAVLDPEGGSAPAPPRIDPSDPEPALQVGPPIACRASEVAIPSRVCAETTAAGFDTNGAEAVVSGILTEVGGDLDRAPGSVDFAGFHSCNPLDHHQLRLVDDAGEAWTVGWDLVSPIEDGSTDALVVGARYTLALRDQGELPNVSTIGFALRDPDPVLVVDVFALASALTTKDRGGLLPVPGPTTCAGADADGSLLPLRPVRFTTLDGDRFTIRSGDSAQVELGRHELTVAVAESSYPPPGGADGGPITVWLAWALP